MTRRVLFRPQVVPDLAEAADWYRNSRSGLETEFLRDFQETWSTVERNPLQYQIVEREMRRAMLRRFPYSVMYVLSDDALLIVGCLHARRNPARWRERLR